MGILEYPAEGTHYASVIFHLDNSVKLHSRVSRYVEGPLSERCLDTLRLFTDQNMWDSMYLYDDGDWIIETILNGTLDFAQDGSPQLDVTTDMGSIAV